VHTVLAIAAVGFAAYALLNLNERPGLFAGILVNTYGLATYFGSTGGLFGIVAILFALSRWEVSGPLRNPEVMLLAWVVFSVMTVPFSPQLEIAADYGAGLIFLALSCYLFGRAGGDNPTFMRDLVLSTCLLIVLCEPAIEASRTTAAARVFGDQNAVGLSELCDVPIVGCMAYLLLDENLRGWRKLGVASFLVFVIVPVAFSFGTRGVFVGAAPAFLVLLLARLAWGRIGKLILDFVLLAGLVGAAALVVYLYLPIPPALLLVAGRVFMGVGESVVDRSALERLRFYDEAKELVGSAPLFGHGLGSFGYLANFSAAGYPHNAILEILVNSGFVGLALFAFGAGGLFRSAVVTAIRQRLNADAWLLVALLVYTFTRLQISESITRGKTFFLLLGICAAQIPFLLRETQVRSPVSPASPASPA
jgi:O-antigen ligase